MNFIDFYNKHLVSTLSIREARIIEFRMKDFLGIGENKKTFRGIAEIEGISCERVRQILIKSQRKLSTRLQIIDKKLGDNHVVFVEKEAFIEERHLPVILLAPWDLFELSVRTTHCLRNKNINTIEKLISISEKELLKIPNFGRKSLREIKEKLAGIGMQLSTKTIN